MDAKPREDRLASEIAARVSGCPDAQDLQCFHEGSLAGAERESVAAHVEDCDACRAALQFLETDRADPVAADAEIPTEVVERSEALISAATAPPDASRVPFSWSVALRVAASIALVAALSVLVFQLFDRGAMDEDLGELRGTTALEPTHPIGRIDAAPDQMTWVAHPRAVTYRVILLDVNMEEIWTRRTEGSTTSLAPDADAGFVVGGRYTWQVEALDAVGAVIESSAAAHFEIAGEIPR